MLKQDDAVTAKSLLFPPGEISKIFLQNEKIFIPPGRMQKKDFYPRIIEPQISIDFHRFYLNIIIILVLIRVNQ